MSVNLNITDKSKINSSVTALFDLSNINILPVSRDVSYYGYQKFLVQPVSSNAIAQPSFRVDEHNTFTVADLVSVVISMPYFSIPQTNHQGMLVLEYTKNSIPFFVCFLLKTSPFVKPTAIDDLVQTASSRSINKVYDFNPYVQPSPNNTCVYISPHSSTIQGTRYIVFTNPVQVQTSFSDFNTLYSNIFMGLPPDWKQYTLISFKAFDGNPVSTSTIPIRETMCSMIDNVDPNQDNIVTGQIDGEFMRRYSIKELGVMTTNFFVFSFTLLICVTLVPYFYKKFIVDGLSVDNVTDPNMLLTVDFMTSFLIVVFGWFLLVDGIRVKNYTEMFIGANVFIFWAISVGSVYFYKTNLWSDSIGTDGIKMSDAFSKLLTVIGNYGDIIKGVSILAIILTFISVIVASIRSTTISAGRVFFGTTYSIIFISYILSVFSYANRI